ncbi:SDR family NAD(P)-dependent oxidoreductase [Gracilibacillus sp. S3-1-1]|uniref:SDR family NAD(P)-dependent oxidoreductase n=1 Tax=Gracilibacillus pellucidus TaxID=3095368 RepID=A0ACC6M8R0_9BACI|nr:SDR family NAD(P)-dependent oxidoreductase [Gracilibacillus sp. S3-1-1]MDX8047242.1 SDR family NAD(P)-dependent oxidoreductase [Gracilibacillus sp. S3-1-1]
MHTLNQQQKREILKRLLDKSEQFPKEDIAIIGVSGQYPMAKNLNDFWENIKQGKNCISEIPKSRWDWEKYYNPDSDEQGFSYTKWGGFIEDIDKFDPAFFNITPKEAEEIDPQERLFLQTAWATLEDAGITRSSLIEQNSSVGVFVGIMNNYYVRQGGTSAYWSLANRISYFMNLQGPSLAVDTACSSSLTAIHLACESLKKGECHTAIAGGVNLIVHPEHYENLSRMNMLSKDDKCKAFGANADGFVDGEGLGAVLLKPLHRAIADNNQIYAVIKGTSINAGGKTSGYTVPNPNAQADLIKVALEEARVSPETISYVEAHGTGTSLGDPIEIAGLTTAFKGDDNFNQSCPIGSVKSNIGHLESAAGIAGLTKVLLQMKHRQLVPSLHSEQLNPRIAFENTPFYVQQQLAEWKQPVKYENGERQTFPRRASISSFGAGGANAHVIVEEYNEPLVQNNYVKEKEYLFLLSGKNEARLRDYAFEFRSFLVENRLKINIADITYTLQIGREAMEERLAIVASDIETLVKKLTLYNQEQRNIENLYFQKEPEAHQEQEIHNCLQQKNLSRLAKLWVSGIDIDWLGLYQGEKPKVVSLPTYPFAKELYWISRNKSILKENREKLHPLLDCNISSLKEQKFTVRLTGHEFFMADHKLGNQMVLPGSAILEMARAAGSFSTEDKICSIKDIFWNQPIVLKQVGKEFADKDVFVSLFMVKDGLEYEVWSITQKEQKVIHAEGLMTYGISELPRNLDINKITSRCSQTMPRDECYNHFQKAGLNYGTSFQTIQGISFNRKESLVELYLPPHLKESQSEFDLHPSLLDGAFQAVIGLLVDKNSKATYLPFSLGEAILVRSLTDKCYAHVTWAEKQPTGSETMYSFMIKIVDKEGQVLVQLNNFTVKMSLIKNTSIKESETFLLQKVWYEKEIESSEKSKGLSGNILLFSSDDNLRNILNEHMSEQDNRIIQVKKGDRFTCVGRDTYEINPLQPDDYQNLMNSLKEEQFIPNYIIHYWSKEGDNKSKDSLSEQLQQSIYSIVYLSKALIIAKYQKSVSLLYVYPFEKEAPIPPYEAVHALAKTIELENPRIATKTIGISSDQQNTRISHIFSKELTVDTDYHSDIQYISGQRYVYSFQDKQTQREESVPLRQNGVYVITGGTGGLGFLFAKYFAEQFQPKLVLVGRREWSLEIENQVKRLEDMGAEVEYISADISDQDQVKDIIKQTKNKFKEIHGIIHSAGVIRDSLLYKKTKQDIQDVLAPKVFGTVWLDKYTKNEKLDFFCLFSSIAGLLGNVGQADYAYANSFMDHFAHLRERKQAQEQRYGRTLSINWPYWEQGGMQLATDEQNRLKQMYGLLPLRTKNGFKAFEKGLAAYHTQLAVMEGNKNELLQAINNPLPKINENSHKSLVESDIQKLRQKTEHYLKVVLSEETKIPVSNIDVEKEFEAFGIDSVIIMRMVRKLEKVFGELPKTLYFEFQTIGELTTYFIEDHYDKLIHILGIFKREAMETSEENHLEEQFSRSKKQRVRFAKTDQRQDDDVAIIGLSGRYPQADNLDEFWEVLKSGRDCITEIPAERWDYMKYYDPEKRVGKTYSKWGGFISDFDKFDSLFFNISPKEARYIDPQERLFLETVWHTIEDAGYKKMELEKRKIGVFVGVMYGQYQLYGIEEEAKGNFVLPNSSYASIANRVSYFFNFHGPSLALDTMCSSSLTAIHLAINSLHQGESEMAVAGGVNLTIHPSKYLLLSDSNFASSDGRCRSFGNGGDGYVPGEGVGAILLKPLNKAIAAGDHIYGVIKASTVNHGGRTNGYTVPNPNAQGNLIKEAMKKANVSPQDISYVEAHGTGTSLGDPIEINGLIQAFGKQHSKQSCSIGSVKSNIGHLESAAGIAALTKVLLQMKHKQLVPSIHASEPNPNINFNQSPFYLQQSLEEWRQPTVLQDGKEKKIPRTAGISSFGAGGSNAHLIIEEYIQQKLPVEVKEEPQILILSARNKNRLQVYSRKMIEFLDKSIGNGKSPVSPISLADIAHTLRFGREELDERLAIIASNIEEFKDKLSQYIQDYHTSSVYAGNINEVKEVTKVSDLRSHERDILSIVNKWRENGELGKIAELWVAGVKIHWDKISLNEGTKQPLPTYPFQRDRHWILQDDAKPNNTAVSNLEIHPLVEFIHPDLSLKNNGVVYQKKLKYNDLIVKDHLVDKKRLFPGVGQLEMAMGAITHLKQSNGYSLSNVVWLQPVLLNQKELELHILIKEKNEMLTFEIQSIPEDKIVTHSKGIIRKESQPRVDQELYISVEDVKLRAAFELEKTEFYERFSKVGIDYGPYFQCIQHIWGNQLEALSMFQIPQGQEEELGQYTLHPSLVDGALQTIAGIEGHDDDLKLPYSAESVVVKRPLSSSGYAYVHSTGKDIYQVELMDNEGHVCISLHDVSVRPAPVKTQPSTSIYYKPRWKLAPLPPISQLDIAANQKVLIIAHDDSAGLDVGLAEAYDKSQVYYIQLGEENIKYSDKYWEIDSSDPYSFKSCLQEIPSDIHVVYFLGGIQGEVTQHTDIDQLNSTQEIGVISLFRLVQALSEKGYDERFLRLHVITNHVYTLSEDELPNPDVAGIHGLTKSMIKEYPHWDISYTDVDLRSFINTSQASVKQEIIKTLIAESFAKSSEDILIHAGQRYVRSLSQISLPPVKESGFRKNGVYFILGGAGGIGLELSKYLVQQFDAKIILIGRSPLNDEKQQKIDEIMRHDGQILYIQADGTDLKSMQGAVNEVKSQFGQIHGVIHSAIVLKDSTLKNMDEESFRAVLSPKVQGSYILYQVFRDEPLDFMMFFSSAQSFSGNAGQGNYAAACTFKDAFAQYLKRTASFPVKIINWGYWGEVGIVASEHYHKLLTAQGIYSMGLNEGIEALERVLHYPIDQVMVMKAEKEVLEHLSVDRNSLMIQHRVNMPSMLHSTIDRNRRPRLNEESLQKSRNAFLEIEKLSELLLLNMFQKLGVFKNSNEQYKKEELKKKLGIIDHYSQLFEALLDIMAQSELIQIEEKSIRTTSRIDNPNLQEEVKNLKHRFNQSDSLLDMKGHVDLLRTCFQNYADILRGNVLATDIIFPNSSMTKVEDIYQNNVIADYFNQLIVWGLRSFIQKRLPTLQEGEKIKILEVGAGTGGTSATVFEGIHEFADQVEYIYTDISLGFINYGRSRYGVQNQFVKFSTLDIEKDIQSQGFDFGGYDVVIAANVLHATKHVQGTLNNIKKLLKTNGWIILNEATIVNNFTTLTFGLLEGWWLYEDSKERLPNSPLLSTSMWKDLLKRVGYEQTVALESMSQENSGFVQNIIFGESNGLSETVQNSNSTTIMDTTELSLEIAEDQVSQEMVAVTQEHTALPHTASIPKNNKREYIEETLINCIVEALEVNIEDIFIEKQFSEYGVDSITGLELIKTINDTLGITLKTTVLFDYTNVNVLTDYILNEYGEIIFQAISDGVIEEEDEDLELLNKLADGELNIDQVYKLMGWKYGAED